MNESKSTLLCYGYVRKWEMIINQQNENIIIPNDIYNLCFRSYYVHKSDSIINGFEVSAKSGIGINEMFEKVTKIKKDIEYYHPQQQCSDYVPPNHPPAQNKKKGSTSKYIIILISMVLLAIMLSNYETLARYILGLIM